jgi:glycosyltransferase involved in cell wall biosynthesis
MKVTVITVCYNSAVTIADTLRSVREQNYKDIEHIIVDGKSTDKSLEIVALEGEHVSTVVSEPDDGIFDAMNKGLALASGDIIGFLNSDDVFADRDVIQSVVEAMHDESIDACYGDLVYVAQHDLNKVVRYWRSEDYKVGLFDRGWIPAHPTFYARKKIYQEYGKFDRSLQLAADFDVLLRLFVIHKIRSVYVHRTFVRMRLGGASNASPMSIVKQNLYVYRAFKKYRLKVGFKLFFFRVFVRLLQFFRKPTLLEELPIISPGSSER